LTQLTPFTQWSISLPQNSINAEIEFSESPEVDVCFFLYHRQFIVSSNEVQIVFHTNAILHTANLSKALFVKSSAIRQSRVKKVSHPGRLSAAAVSSAAPSPVTRADVLQQLSYPIRVKLTNKQKQKKTNKKKRPKTVFTLTHPSQGSVMMGWDCVLCMDLKKVNTILLDQYLFQI
jgi:hypothetical protein